MPAQMFRLATRATRHYARRLVIDRIGDENTKESKATLKAVRMFGAGTVIAVVCLLFWASSMSAPVREELVEVRDLAKDIRESR